MITTEIRVNGALIGHIYAVNKGPANNLEYDDPRRLYKYEYYRPDVGKLIDGMVIHNTTEGAERLIQIILNSVQETLQLESKSA